MKGFVRKRFPKTAWHHLKNCLMGFKYIPNIYQRNWCCINKVCLRNSNLLIENHHEMSCALWSIIFINFYSFCRALGLTNIMVNTIDSYQGLEKDVIVISNARTSGIGFLSNPQRLNVALTRAKKCLILCGNFRNLEVFISTYVQYLLKSRTCL